MDHKYFSMFDMAIVGVPVIGICIWQLISVTREINRDQALKNKAGSEDAARHPVGEHREDDG